MRIHLTFVTLTILNHLHFLRYFSWGAVIMTSLERFWTKRGKECARDVSTSAKKNRHIYQKKKRNKKESENHSKGSFSPYWRRTCHNSVYRLKKRKKNKSRFYFKREGKRKVLYLWKKRWDCDTKHSSDISSPDNPSSSSWIERFWVQLMSRRDYYCYFWK